MKKFLLFAVAALVSIAANAQPLKKITSIEEPAQKTATTKFVKNLHPRWSDMMPSGKFMTPQRAAEDYTIIAEQPEGELKTYKRAGKAFSYSSSTGVTQNEQTGTIDIVFGADNAVYLKQPLSTLSVSTWVEGKLSEDGTTITLPLFQHLYYASGYDATLLIAIGTTDEEGYLVSNEEVNEVTYTINDDVITLNGASEEEPLGAFWSDDHSWQGIADYESVYTPYVANTTLVTLPEGLEAVDMPMTGMFYEDVYDSEGSELSATVKVARDGNDFYIQGLVQLLPEAWVMGQLDAETGEITVPVTYMGQIDGQNAYVMGYSSDGIVPVVLNYNEDLNAMETNGYVMLNPSELTLDVYELLGYYQALYIGERPALVEVPEDADSAETPYTATIYDGSSSQEISGTVTVALDDDGFVYIQGLIQEVPEGWIKGEFSDDLTQVVFPCGQYVGASENGSVYIVGQPESEESEEEVADIVFSYDLQKNVMKLQNVLYASGKPNQIYYYSAITEATIGLECDEMWVASKQGYTNAQDVAQITIAADEEGQPTVTGTLELGENTTNNNPKYYDSGEALRMYAGNTLTITSQKAMSKIVFTLTGNEKQKKLEANIGEYTFDGDEIGTWTGEANEVVFNVPNVSKTQARIQSIQIFYMDYSTILVEVPEDLTTDVYQFQGTDLYDNSQADFQVKVGFSGDYVYFQGLSQLLPDAWVRGTMAEDGTVNIPNWHLGFYNYLWLSYDVTFGGATFIYDEQAGKFTCEAGYQTYADEQVLDEFGDVTLTKVIEVAATPQAPEITEFRYIEANGYGLMKYNIPTVGTNDEVLVSDKLSYQFFVQTANGVENLTLPTSLYTEFTEDMTEIPYAFTDNYDISNRYLYLNFDLDVMKDWTKIGMQSIYRGMGEENKSEITWYELDDVWTAVGIESVSADKRQPAVVYDLQGRRVAQPGKGLYIVGGRKMMIK